MNTEASLVHWVLGRSFVRTSHLSKLVVNMAVTSPVQKGEHSRDQVPTHITSTSLFYHWIHLHNNPYSIINREAIIKKGSRYMSTNKKCHSSTDVIVFKAPVWLSGRCWFSVLLASTQAPPESHHSDLGPLEVLVAGPLLRVMVFWHFHHQHVSEYIDSTGHKKQMWRWRIILTSLSSPALNLAHCFLFPRQWLLGDSNWYTHILKHAKQYLHEWTFGNYLIICVLCIELYSFESSKTSCSEETSLTI